MIKKDGTVIFMYPYQNPVPKPVDPWDQIKIDPPPGEEYELQNDGRDNPVWSLSNKKLKEVVRRIRKPLIEKTLSTIDQYRNETVMIKEGIIIERAVSDTEYVEALTYLQKLKDWPEKATNEKSITEP
jgi:hypothetical protein